MSMYRADVGSLTYEAEACICIFLLQVFRDAIVFKYGECLGVWEFVIGMF